MPKLTNKERPLLSFYLYSDRARFITVDLLNSLSPSLASLDLPCGGGLNLMSISLTTGAPYFIISKVVPDLIILWSYFFTKPPFLGILEMKVSAYESQ